VRKNFLTKSDPTAMNSKRRNEKEERGGILPRLCFWVLALAVPLGLALLLARAATSEQIKSTGALKVPRFLHHRHAAHEWCVQ
jgi:hypothetical protein